MTGPLGSALPVAPLDSNLSNTGSGTASSALGTTPNPAVVVSPNPYSNQTPTTPLALESNGNLQTVTELLEGILTELRVHSIYLAQLGIGVISEQPDELRTDPQILAN